MRNDLAPGNRVRWPWLSACFVVLSGGAAVAATPSDAPTPASQNLTCNFKAVQTGQFQELSYITGPVGGILTMRFASSPADSLAGRAVMIGDDKAVVVALLVQPEQTLFVDADTANDASMMSLFTASQQDGGIPAAYSRQMMVGKIPIVSQYTGSCTAQ